jgi:plasmid stability protein
MSNLSIKDVPEAWAETLRQRALRNHRSLQGELMAIIEQAVVAEADASPPPQQPARAGARQGTVAGFDRRGHPIMRYGWKTIEQISAEMRAKYPLPIVDAPLGVDIIREDRDSR